MIVEQLVNLRQSLLAKNWLLRLQFFNLRLNAIERSPLISKESKLPNSMTEPTIIVMFTQNGVGTARLVILCTTTPTELASRRPKVI